MTTSFPAASVLGYPRIGPRRELKKALEAFWAGKADAASVEQVAADLRRRTRTRLAELGLSTTTPAIPSAFSFYDHVLDTTALVGAVPARFADLVGPDGSLDLAGYSTVARGRGDDLPLEMTKWFDTNYHYLVPEIGPETVFSYAGRRPVTEFAEALADGVLTRPVLVGPVTYLALAKATEGSPEGFSPLDRLADLLPVYQAVLADLAAAGATWVQLDEPALVSDTLAVPAAAVTAAYQALAGATDRPTILVAAPYADLGDQLATLAATDVEAVGIDLVRGSAPTAAVPGLATKTLVAGVIDGHNIWRADLDAKLAILERLELLGAGAVTVGTSTSLFHVPHTVADEPALDATLASWLAFADEKVTEVVTLAEGLVEGREAIHEALLAASDALAARAAAPGVVRPEVRARVSALTEDAFSRGSFDARRAAQDARLHLPPLPTTTIGSFPQTPQIRKARAAFGKGELSAAQYEDEMRAEIGRVVQLQEDLGLDVLVHGEPERNDMVQYFAENLDGFSVTQNGWVQSYGSRCTRPSILWGDVTRPAPITVAWSSYTASLTDKPVKGMLTGPVTILAWSFVRDDQPLADTAFQVGLALRDEIGDLEAAGIPIVQVDEPALRELLPLKTADQSAYLDWAVRSFRLSTAGVRADTQIHTHLCYSEFGEVIEAIDGLDADVTSIEAARSKMEIVDDIAGHGYPRGIGPGVWDIHSPRVPSEAEVETLLAGAVRSIDAGLLWVNPDCGLKTRRYEEVTPSLEHLVAATKAVRATL
ncbi:MAG: 5-methyltetrahydropteroyltriglutamate--homocysteine S-methyltransferase [Cellulomonas sp.]|nr:5-methyltetrahydropteroyltriglutamate--homocysteine S-methyltransferase [Cellulomonas sp.]